MIDVLNFHPPLDFTLPVVWIWDHLEAWSEMGPSESLDHDLEALKNRLWSKMSSWNWGEVSSVPSKILGVASYLWIQSYRKEQRKKNTVLHIKLFLVGGFNPFDHLKNIRRVNVKMKNCWNHPPGLHGWKNSPSLHQCRTLKLNL